MNINETGLLATLKTHLLSLEDEVKAEIAKGESLLKTEVESVGFQSFVDNLANEAVAFVKSKLHVI